MASILKKVQQKKDTKQSKVTNLIALNEQDVIEDKIAPHPQKKVEEDTEQIDLSSIKTEKKVEQEPKAEEVVSNKENFTWGDTKDMDDQEALSIAEQQAAFTDKKDDDKGKKVMKSWVPQKREDNEAFVATFNEDDSFLPELNSENLNKKVEKKAPTFISRAEEPSSSSSNPPRFQNSTKGGFKQLELSEQQKKLLEIEERNKKEYKSATGAPQTYPTTEQSNTMFGSSFTTSQPPRFMNKKAAEGGNFVALQKTELDMKQEEAQKRVEERLKELKVNSENNTIQHTEQTQDWRPRQHQQAGLANPEDAEKKETSNTTEEAQKPSLKFINSNKATQGPNFKPLENKEVKIPEILENKKYLTKKEDKGERTEQTEKKEQKERKPRQQKQEESDSEESGPEFDENGFKIVKDDKPKKRSYKNGSNKKAKDSQEKQTEQVEA